MQMKFAKALAGASMMALVIGWSAPAAAQANVEQPTPPTDYNIDENGVDLATGRFYLSMTDVAIGSSNGGLAYSRNLRNGGYDNLYDTSLNVSGGMYTVSIGARSDTFAGPTGDSTKGTGARLVAQPDGTFWYVDRDGLRYVFSSAARSTNFRVAQYRAIQIVESNGRITTIEYDARSNGIYNVTRPTAVSSSDGYRLTFRYQSDAVEGSDFSRFMTVASATASNSAVENCTPANCSPTDPRWRSATYAWNAERTQETRTDPNGNKMVTTIDGAGRITDVRPFGSPYVRLAMTYDASGRVTRVNTISGPWIYAYSDNGDERTATVTSPVGLQRVTVSSISKGKVIRDRTGTGGTTSYEYDAKNRLTKLTAPEGNAVVYAYDARDNVSTTTAVAKGGGASFSVTASFPATCDNLLTCNKPTSVVDARGKTTSYAYDPTHGGVTRITRPLGSETRFTYTPVQSSYYGPGGGIIAGPPIWKLAATSECSTGNEGNCVGTANETRIEIGYAPASQYNNAQPTSIVIRAGDSSVSSMQQMRYDILGNVVTTIDPLGASTTYSHNKAGQVTELREPDPDNEGPIGARATIIGYDAEGRTTQTQSGYYPTNTDGSGGSFTPIQILTTGYNEAGLKVGDTVTAGGAVVSLTQYDYDGARRLVCVNRRISRSAFSDKCDQVGDSTGTDVIDLYSYGSDGRVSAMDRGGRIVSYTYTPNGKLRTLTDGNSNTTTYSYDNYDRQSVIGYADGNYESFEFNNAGDLLRFVKRDESAVINTVDDLGRITAQYFSDEVNGQVRPYFNYDQLGRLTLAANVFSRPEGGTNVTFNYDALGRLTASNGVSYQYDAAGRQTRMTYPDGYFVTYDHLITGQVTAIRENGGFALAAYEYDGLGRRKSLQRGNGTRTDFSYDNASRLSGLVQDLAGSDRDLSIGLTYDGLSRIRSRSTSNDAYAWTGLVSATRSYGVNSLNQYTSAGGVAFGYDGKGNLTNSGGQSYAYNSLNQLVSSSNGASLAYDPMGRLIYSSGGSETTRFAYDGQDMIAEYDGAGNLVRRHVHGVDVDEPLVTYEGGGRQYYHADERGSVVATSDDVGNASQVLSYDDYGIPAAGNTRRFQYTGQLWLPDLGLYHYKARTYSPTLGRFMQTDPLGYVDGMNRYAYVGADPINKADPSGLCGGIVRDEHNNVIGDGNAGSGSCGGGGGYDYGYGYGYDYGYGYGYGYGYDYDYDYDYGYGYDYGGGGGSGGGGAVQPEPQNNQCPAVPSLGLGRGELNRRVNASAARALLRNRDFFSIPSIDNRSELFLKSVPGARNDTKSYVRGSAEYGNFLFGAEAAAGGLSLQEALNWGANAQVFQDLLKLQVPSGSDNPGDADATTRGYNYYKAGCSK